MEVASFRKIKETAKTPRLKRDWECSVLAVNTGMAPPSCKSIRHVEKQKISIVQEASELLHCKPTLLSVRVFLKINKISKESRSISVLRERTGWGSNSRRHLLRRNYVILASVTPGETADQLLVKH